jgi:hypothetical protein
MHFVLFSAFTQGRVSVMKAIKPSVPIWKAVSLITSNHFNYNSKILVMPHHNIGRHLVAISSVVFRASVIKWNGAWAGVVVKALHY